MLTGELFKKDKELQASRLRVIDMEEEMKKLTQIKEKYSKERLHLVSELRQHENELSEMRATNEG